MFDSGCSRCDSHTIHMFVDVLLYIIVDIMYYDVMFISGTTPAYIADGDTHVTKQKSWTW